MDTIFALATARGRAGVAVVRISGAEAHSAVRDLAGPLPRSGRSLRSLRDRNDSVLDEALVLTFAGPASFTGEDVVELHLHGSPAIIAAVLRCLTEDGRLRGAEAGEFTRRALANGKLDLAQVEGLADLIDAETEGQRLQAQRVFSGAMGEMAERWRRSLVRAAALLEATIDFVDEEVPVDVAPEVRELVGTVRRDLQAQADGVRIAERVRDGFEVAILGPPNIGKSTLLNRLAGREAAITSEIAGTTRDVIEVRMDLGGLPVTLLDTAGLRETEETIEALGIARARERAASADLRIHLLQEGGTPEVDVKKDDIVVRGKADLGETAERAVSGLTGLGVDGLVAEVERVLTQRVSGAGLAIRERHALAMRRAATRLSEVEDRLDRSEELADVLAEDLRDAIRAIDSIVGRVDVEHVLDEIFSSFCIGK